MLAGDRAHLWGALQQARLGDERIIPARQHLTLEQNVLAPRTVPAQMVNRQIGGRSEEPRTRAFGVGGRPRRLGETQCRLLDELLGDRRPHHHPRYVRDELRPRRLVDLGQKGPTFHHDTNAPAHTLTTWPAMPLAASEASQATAAAVSSRRTGRPNTVLIVRAPASDGGISRARAINASVSWIVRVSGMPPDRTQFTRTPAGPNSAASERVIASRAPQAAVIPAMNGTKPPLRLAERITIAPRPCAAMRRAATRAVRNCEPTMSLSGRRNVSRGRCTDGVA